MSFEFTQPPTTVDKIEKFLDQDDVQPENNLERQMHYKHLVQLELLHLLYIFEDDVLCLLYRCRMRDFVTINGRAAKTIILKKRNK